MEKVYRKLKLGSKNINLNLFLNETFNLTGSYQVDENSISLSNGNGFSREITGISESRLTEVETYDITTPYKVGINGVSNISYNSNGTIQFVEYRLDEINYKTFLPSEETIYSYVSVSEGLLDYDNFSLIKDDTLLGITGEPEIDNQIFIERQVISAKDPHIRLQYIKNIGDLLTYGGGTYFKINS